MKILYIHQYFITPEQPGGTRSYWFARALIEAGFKVTMLTSRNEQKRNVEREEVDGIEVIYIRNSYSNNMSILRRMFSFVSFMYKSTVVGFKEKNIDFVYSTSTPLTVGIPALFLKWFKNKPFVFEVRDLWPEVPIQMGALKNPFFRFLAKKLEKTIYKNALHIVALSPGMKEGVMQSKIVCKKITVIPNMSKNDKFFPHEENRNLMKQYHLKDDVFYVIHFGAMGIANGLDYIVDAAFALQKEGANGIEFLLVGGGSVEEKLKQKVNQEEIRNIHFLGSFAMDEMSEIVNIADCSIVTFQNLPILRTNSPNKLFDSLSAAKPVIVNSAGWTKNLVEDNHCGAFVDPDKPMELADLLIEWANNKECLKVMGDNARDLAYREFDKKILCANFVRLINKVIEE